MSTTSLDAFNTSHALHVKIEIPENSYVKYEWDARTSSLLVDRFLPVPMPFPCNYGLIPNTLGGDGDPLDALVFTPHPVIPMAEIECRAIGLLEMEDEGGEDHKILMVPTQKLTSDYNQIQSLSDMEMMNPKLLNNIRYFFTHYKDLEPHKWVRLKEGWRDANQASLEIQKGMARFLKKHQ